MIAELTAVSHCLIHPLWDKFEKNSIISDIGYKEDDQMPGRYWPTQGIVIDSPEKFEAKKGDTIYFTWNALSFRDCISDRKHDNIFALKHSYIAYKHDDKLYSMDDFLLLEPIQETEEAKITDSGIVLSGFAVKGTEINPEVVEVKTTKKLHGKIAVLPKELPCDEIYDPIADQQLPLKAGINVCIDKTSDVPVEIEGKFYYRTRFSEILYGYQ